MKILKSIFISCREATHLHTVYTDGKSSWTERMQIQIHLAVCSLCRQFYKQSDKLAEFSRNLSENNISYSKLSESSKEKMNQLLEQEASK
jgi:predicted anti-sigma-YlaC factor YlaD